MEPELELGSANRNAATPVEMHYIEWSTMIRHSYDVEELKASPDLHSTTLAPRYVLQVLEFLNEPVEWAPRKAQSVDGRLHLVLPDDTGRSRRVFASRTLVCDLDLDTCRPNNEEFRALIREAAESTQTAPAK